MSKVWQWFVAGKQSARQTLERCRDLMICAGSLSAWLTAGATNKNQHHKFIRSAKPWPWRRSSSELSLKHDPRLCIRGPDEMTSDASRALVR